MSDHPFICLSLAVLTHTDTQCPANADMATPGDVNTCRCLPKFYPSVATLILDPLTQDWIGTCLGM